MTVWTEMGNEGCTETDAISFFTNRGETFGKIVSLRIPGEKNLQHKTHSRRRNEIYVISLFEYKWVIWVASYFYCLSVFLIYFPLSLFSFKCSFFIIIFFINLPINFSSLKPLSILTGLWPLYFKDTEKILISYENRRPKLSINTNHSMIACREGLNKQS